MPRECALCADADSEEAPLIELPCFTHWVCQDCIQDYFVSATNNESLYPPRCCDEPIPLDRFAEHVPENVQANFRLKEQGEYTILPKYRVYCASALCGKFLDPNGHIKDGDSDITYAVCDSDDCFQATCCTCKTLLLSGTQGHVCQVNDNDQKFKEAAEEKGYQECFVCGATVELAEACNHITCECGNEFCYICGKPWQGYHGCPRYGVSIYDEDGFNQEGYHRETGRNREGMTRREQALANAHAHAQENEGDDDQDDENQEPQQPLHPTISQQVWARLDPDAQALMDALDPDTRQEALLQFMVQLQNEGVVFGEPPPPVQPQQPDGGGDDEGNGERDEDEDEHDHDDPPGLVTDQQVADAIAAQLPVIEEEAQHLENEAPAAAQNATQALPILGANPESNSANVAVPSSDAHSPFAAQHGQPHLHLDHEDDPFDPMD